MIYKNEYTPIVSLNDEFKKRKILDIVGGELNPDKVFYVIKRYPGTGLFSNLAYVINHIQIANRMGLEKEVKELKVQMSEYLSVRVKGARDNAS